MFRGLGVNFRTEPQDQNFDPSVFPKSNIWTTSCVIPGGKYIICGPGGFRPMRAEEWVCFIPI